jgi:ribosomal protein S18 acetylase RimI-like enzyme
MSLPVQFELRRAVPSDALCLGALAMQVFFDTYATSGINSDLANEAREHCSEEAYARRLASPGIEITLAEIGGNLAGFIDVQSSSACPVQAVVGPEVFRLYVQAPFQNRGLGKGLLRCAELQSQAQGARAIWLTAWVGNASAVAFYPLAGYEKVGTMQYAINGKNYENYVFAKQLPQSVA